MSDKDNRRQKQKSPPPSSHDRDEHDPETSAPPHATTDTTHDFQDNRPEQLEPEEDDDHRPVVLDFALDFTSHPPHFHPVPGHHSQDMSYDHLHDPINYPPSVIMPLDHRILPPYNYAGSSYGSYSEPYYSEAFDASTQIEAGTYHDQYHGREGANTPVPVDDLQQIASLRSSSHDIGGIEDETASRLRTGDPSSNDHVSSQNPNEGQPVPNEELFPGSLSTVEYHYHPSSVYPYSYPMHPTTYQYNIPNTPIQTHQYPPHASPPMPAPYHIPNTPIQTQRYPFAAPVEGIMPEYDDDDDSSLDRKPAALPRPARGRSHRGANIPPKGKMEKVSPKKKARPKKRQIRASRQSYGSSSSSSPPSGGVSSPEYSFIKPDPEELNEAKTDRAREALMNWHERLRDLYKFKKEKGHSKC